MPMSKFLDGKKMFFQQQPIALKQDVNDRRL
jgi:hypothetical protein